MQTQLNIHDFFSLRGNMFFPYKSTWKKAGIRKWNFVKSAAQGTDDASIQKL